MAEQVAVADVGLIRGCMYENFTRSIFVLSVGKDLLRVTVKQAN
jgi:hypothetical protein